MKILVIFALALATASAFKLRNVEIKQRNVVVPVKQAEGRIVNGKDAEVGQFPYQVVLDMTIDGNLYVCGGSLIGNEWILTAAHCTIGASSIDVTLGATVRTETEVTYTATQKDIIMHPNYDDETLDNDIALIKIPAVNYSDTIQAVKLPAISNSYPTYVGEEAIASGWGHTYDGGVDVDHLQWGAMNVISNLKCGRVFEINSSNICVIPRDNAATCSGDSGGPLVLESSKVLVGVTSYGSPESCALGYPEVFTCVTSYLDWIEENTGISY